MTMLFYLYQTQFRQFYLSAFQSDVVVDAYAAIGLLPFVFAFEFGLSAVPFEEPVKGCVRLAQTMLQRNTVDFFQK